MKHFKKLALAIALLITLTSCGTAQKENKKLTETTVENITSIELSDKKITVDKKEIQNNTSEAVYVANDIVYYESGKDFTYGEGTEEDAHSTEEAESHRVIHITKPGTYSISGNLSQGQIAVDLGKDAKNNPDSKVTLILNNADITCSVAPAIIFYSVYECGNDDEDKASKDVDTTNAGANIIIADETTNNINGSYVARIYEPGTVTLNEDKTEVEDAEKLHKYDGALYSKMSMNVDGGKKGTGVLNINAENEGLDSELHLTVNGGKINIESGNDGINTNEDNVSVTTVNGGNLTIKVNGKTGEGDGIDSNGWLVINGGTVIASACSDSADAGIDSDKGIHINGGTVMATGHMLDQIESGGQNYAVFNFAEKQTGKNTITFKNNSDKKVMDFATENDFSILIFSSPELKAGNYTLWCNEKQLTCQQGGGMLGRPEGMAPPENAGEVGPPEKPEDFTPPEKPEENEPSEGYEKLEGMEPPTGQKRPEEMKPADGEPPFDKKPELQPGTGEAVEPSTTFVISDGANMFGNISQNK